MELGIKQVHIKHIKGHEIMIFFFTKCTQQFFYNLILKRLQFRNDQL